MGLSHPWPPVEIDINVLKLNAFCKTTIKLRDESKIIFILYFSIYCSTQFNFMQTFILLKLLNISDFLVFAFSDKQMLNLPVKRKIVGSVLCANIHKVKYCFLFLYIVRSYEIQCKLQIPFKHS